MAEINNLDSQLEYLSLNVFQKIGFKVTHFFKGIPHALANFGRSFPRKGRTAEKGVIRVGNNLKDAAMDGDVWTRISFLIMGTGLLARHQIIRGCLYLLFEIVFFVFLGMVGVPNLAGLGSLGQLSSVSYDIYDQKTGLDLPLTVLGDNSFTIVLYSIISICLMVIFVFLWYNQLVDSLELQQKSYVGKFASDKATLRNVLDKSYDKTLLSIPMFGLVLFTLIPIIMMVMIGFTNYNSYHATPLNLFDWVGFYNFGEIFSSSGEADQGIFISVFGQVLLWTLIWAFFATFSNYFIGMIVAMIINIKGIKLKKVWRTILITTIAVPQFVSLLLMSQMFSDTGLWNSILEKWGWIKDGIPWFSNEILSKVMIIVINTWIGIPYTMLICTGLLMNIPADLYESARIDGASPTKMYMKITLPYMLFVTTPYLISQFVGNINNFNVIYFLSNGGPGFTFAPTANVPSQITFSGVGRTDLLITWIYKMTVTSSHQDYALASVLGVLIFAIVALFSLAFYGKSKSVNDEEAFQ